MKDIMTSGGRIPDQYRRETDGANRPFPAPSQRQMSVWRHTYYKERPTLLLHEIAKHLGLVLIANALNRLRLMSVANKGTDEPTASPEYAQAYFDLRDRFIDEALRTFGKEDMLPLLNLIHPTSYPLPEESKEEELTPAPQKSPYLRTKTLRVGEVDPERLSSCPNIHRSGSVKGMKDQYWGKEAKCVRCGNYIYNVDSDPEIYDIAR